MTLGVRLSAIFTTATLFWGCAFTASAVEQDGFVKASKFEPPQTNAEGLVAFWNFQQPAGEPFTAVGMGEYPLEEMHGVIGRAEDGVFGPRSARIKPGQWLRVPRAKLGPLDIHGKKAQVTLIAWIKRESKPPWQSIAGVWDETHGKRQYMLFLNARTRTDSRTLERVECRDLVHGHVSSVGGPTPGHNVCKTYSSGGTAIPLGKWTMIAMIYDGQFSKVYVDGKLDAVEHYNPFPYDEGLFDGDRGGADFTVGANHVAGVVNNNRFGGLIGGLAVFNRALSDDEMQAFGPKP